MIPYFELPIIIATDHYLIFTFTIFLILGVTALVLVCILRAHQYKFDKKYIFEAVVFVVIPSLYGAHFLGILLYHPQRFLTKEGLIDIITNPLSNTSSFGGFLTGILAFFLYTRLFKISSEIRSRLYDIFVQGAIVGMIFGRLGCSLIHDHLGTNTTFFLAIDFPDGPRHDLGFYEFLFLLIMQFPISLLIHDRKLRPGLQTAITLITYGFFRFFFDSLRIKETRYLSLTPAQYGCFFFILLGIYILRKTHDRNELTQCMS